MSRKDRYLINQERNSYGRIFNQPPRPIAYLIHEATNTQICVYKKN